MKKFIFKNIAMATLLWNTATLNASDFSFFLTENDGLLDKIVETNGTPQYQYTSPFFQLEGETNEIYFTFLKGHATPLYPYYYDDSGYPCIALAEFFLYDADGELITLSKDNFDTNAPETKEGSFSGLCDGDYATYWHSTWSDDRVNDYHYLKVTLPEGMALSKFKFGYVTRNERQTCPAVIQISSSSEIGNHTLSGECGENLTWSLSVNSGELVIDGTGNMLSFPSSASAPWKGCAVKSVMINEGVTSIGNFAFEGMTLLRTVSIPQSLEILEARAFNSCSNLTRIDFSNTSITFIDKHTFQKCSMLEEILLPTNLQEIEEGALELCTSLSEIKFPQSLKKIGVWAFADCRGLESIDLAKTSVTDIPQYAFKSCTALKELDFPQSLEYIDASAFNACYAIESVDLSKTSMTIISNDAFAYCYNLSNIIFPQSLVRIDTHAFNNCHSLTEIILPETTKYIGGYAFYGCGNLKDVNLQKIETIGESAFSSTGLSMVNLSSAISVGKSAFTNDILFTIDNAAPAQIDVDAFSENSLFIVPSSAETDYKNAEVWSNYALRIVSKDVAIQNIEVSAYNQGSAILDAIGGESKQQYVIDLKVTGTINGYDIVVLRDKMVELRFLDLSAAKIIANSFGHYKDGDVEYCTEDDVLSPYSFKGKYRLQTIKLPTGIKSIEHNAFSECYRLSDIIIPDKVTSIGASAFNYCTGLQSVRLPNGLELIGAQAFSSTGIKEISFPTTLKTIGWGAFESTLIETVRIPSSLQIIENNAFGYCTNLKKVYTYTIEPTSISENTFSNIESTILYVPKASGQNYYWNEGWRRFAEQKEFDEVYEYFYLNGDHTLDESTGAVDGTPEADLNTGSGLIVEEEVEQNMSDLNIHYDGTNGGSIIAGSPEGNINADNLHVHINVQSGRWYFFCFPFDLKKENISFGNEGTQYVFRCYDGSKRAEGNSGWKNVTEENGKFLKAATGYIFQCSQSDVLTISLADVKFKKEDKYNELVAHAAANMQDASWNFVGNPYLSYYDMAAIGYDAPITVWNGYTYEAIKPGDDDYQLAPFEAFFVQKPEGTDVVEYDGEEQTTFSGSQAKAEAARARRRAQAVNLERLLVNITISNGQETDRTRIVFNDKVSMGYELECDAAKFEAAGVPQIYSIDSRAVKYAINERPVAEGIVTLGYSVPTQGNYTLAAPRMDTPIYIKDNLNGTVHDFAEGDYEFASDAGTFEDRFTVVMKAGETGIDNSEFTIQNSEIYNVKGQRVENMQEKGVYVKENRKVVKF